MYYACVMDMPEADQKITLDERELQGYEWVSLKDAENFCQNHQVRGTQRHLLFYLAELYAKSTNLSKNIDYNFNHEMPNTTHEHRSTIRGTDKYFK